MADMKNKHVEMRVEYITDGDSFEFFDNHGVIVRCKNCKYYTKKWKYCKKIQLDGFEHDFYCSYAEKKE